eukprot:1740282-Rhodomonas_salina.1
MIAARLRVRLGAAGPPEGTGLNVTLGRWQPAGWSRADRRLGTAALRLRPSMWNTLKPELLRLSGPG